MLRGQKQYFEVDLIPIDNAGFKQGDFIHDSVEGKITVIYPNDDEKTYDFKTEVGHAYVDFSVGDDDEYVSPTGTYRIHATTDNNEYEEYWGGFRVTDHYEN